MTVQSATAKAFEVETLDDLVEEGLNSICKNYSISEKDLFFKWESYSINSRLLASSVPTLDQVSAFTSWVASQFSKSNSSSAIPMGASSKANIPLKGSASGMTLKNRVFTKDSLDSVLASNNITSTPLKPPPASHSFDQLSSPAFGASAFSPGAARDLAPPLAKQSSSDFSTHFSLRKLKGKKELVYGDHIVIPPPSLEEPSTLCQVNVVTGQQTKGYRYMYEKLTEKGDLLNERINYFARLYANQIQEIRRENAQDDDVEEKGQLEEGQELLLFAHPSVANQQPQFYIGRISCDSVVEGTKLNLQSLVLETSREIGAGARVKIDFSGLLAHGTCLNLFPGMIICVEATNPSGSILCATRMLECPLLDAPVTNGADYKKFYPDGKNKNLSIIFASGPFALNDSLEYEPLTELLEVVQKEQPHLLVLMGPFVDVDHPLFKPGAVTDVDLTFEEVFRFKISSKLEKVRKVIPHLQIVLIPSQKEATLEWVAYPQPPIGSSIRDHDHIQKLQELGLMTSNGQVWANLFPNPVQFTCNEVVVALSNLDSLRDLIQLGMTINPPQPPAAIKQEGQQDQQPPPQPKDKFTTSFANIMDQRHFYPVFPHSAGACIDSTRCLGSQPQDPCVLQVKPDILIMPSRLQYAIKQVNGSVCINPGFLVKGRTAGTFCKIQIHHLQSEGMSEEDVFEHCVADRTRVEIIKL